MTDPLWFKDAVFYELHVKAFHDGNGDGIGDFRGLIEKLDYLEWLGVTCLWLLPFFPSPLRDDGYDVANYVSIAPDYGSLEDFREFLDEAHRRRMRVIVDLVLNHTSDQHPMVSRGEKFTSVGQTRPLRLERHGQAVSEGTNYLYRYREIELDLGSRRASLLLASIF